MIKPAGYIILVILALCLVNTAKAQCPENIGFDYGTFQNWQGATGFISKTDGSLSFSSYGISPDVHALFYRKDNQTDPYGNFPIASPNGSSCCVRLGNDVTGVNKAQQLSYTFTIPKNDPDYSLIYYYAVVLQDPPHQPWQQPRFAAKVFDVTDNQYITCGNFDFVASGNLPGFQLASRGTSVYYKDWSPVTINLLGFSGKTLRLEFTTSNCAPGGHFGYAYIDVNQNCSSPVSGNVFCASTTTPVTLVAPSGFQEYYWYNANDLSTVIGTSSTLFINPAPTIGTSYAVRIVPFPGIGCEDTIYTKIQATEPMVLKVKDTISTCSVSGVNLTDSTVTAGSNADFTYTYYSDSTCTNNIVGPQAIMVSGTYYIQATTPGGCSIVKPIKVYVFGQSSLIVNNPAPICKPGLIDITVPAITQGSDPGLTFTYWKDAAATKPLLKPGAVDSAGVYYIKGTNTGGCSIIQPVTVAIVNLPKLVIAKTAACITADITAATVTVGSDAGLTFSYWLDSLATQTLTNPGSITQSGKYFIKAVNSTGCDTIKPVNVTINPVPTITITDPAPVVFPQTVDITTAFTPQTGLSYTYWHDAKATISLANPNKVERQSTYYIKTDNGACSIISPVNVTISKPPDIDFSPNTFTPNGDGINDVFKFNIPLSTTLKYFKIYASWGQLLFETTDPNKYWDGMYLGKPMPVGTYYWIFAGYDTYSSTSFIKSGYVSVIR